MIAWQNHPASRLHNGLLWALGALCSTALSTSLARVFTPEAGLWSAIVSSALAALLIWAVTPKATTITPPSAPTTNTGTPATAHELNSAFKNKEVCHIFKHKSA